MEDCRYNSAVYTSLAANAFFVTAVTNNHFEPGAYSNASGMFDEYWSISLNNTSGKKHWEIGYQIDSHDIQLFTSMLEGYNASTQSYEDLTPAQCISLYNTPYLSTRRNLFLITDHTSNSTFNNTLLRLSLSTTGFQLMQDCWICPRSLWGPFSCNTNELASKVASGHPWPVTLKGGQEVEVRGCKSEITKAKCKV